MSVIPTKKFLSLFDPNAPAAPVPAPAAAMFTQAQADAIAQQARKEEKDKLYKELEKKKEELKEAREKIEAAAIAAKDLSLKTMPVDEAMKTQLADITKSLAEEKAARIAAENRAAQEGLERYRSEAISRAQATGVKLMTDYVVGSTPEQIESSIHIAKAEYTRMEQEVLANIAKAGFAVTPLTAAPAAPAGLPAIPSPHFVPAYVAQGLPAVVNPQPAAQPPPLSNDDLVSITSEESIRNGTYAKNRNALIAGLRQAVQPGQSLTFGSNPRFSGPQQVAPPQFQPQYAPPAPSLPYSAVPQPTQFQPPVLPSPVPQPGSQLQLDQMSPDQLTAYAAAIRSQGGPNGPQARAALVTRFTPTPPVKQG